MNTAKRIEALVGEAAALLDLPPPRAYGSGGAWRLDFDADTAFDIECDDDARHVMVACDIGRVHEEARLALYEILLQYNFIWTQTGGVRMALDGSTDRVVLMYELAHDDREPANLCDLLSNMACIRRAWAEILRDCALPRDAMRVLRESAAADTLHFAVKA
jgi:hypothetical protein